ncbi:hypothetical protein BST61_g288 [Cercospora zeina]
MLIGESTRGAQTTLQEASEVCGMLLEANSSIERYTEAYDGPVSRPSEPPHRQAGYARCVSSTRDDNCTARRLRHGLEPVTASAQRTDLIVRFVPPATW